MAAKGKISMEIFKAVSRIIESTESLETMASHVTQLLTGALNIKGSSLFVLNPETRELEVLASFGLSPEYMNKGPVIFKKSIRNASKDRPVVIKNVRTSAQLQYPEEAKKEGIGAIVHLPITFSEKIIGALRLYHSKSWSVSAQDLDVLELLARNLALAMMYTRLLNALLAIRETVEDVHTVWMKNP